MAHYRQVGEVPPKRHTQFRDAEGRLYYEELMGEEGFSSDSSLLYHRGVPSAIVGSEVWELPDQTRTPNHPLKPRHLKLHTLFAARRAPTPSTERRLVLGNNDVRISYVVTGRRSRRRTTATPSATSACTSRPAAARVETVFGVLSYRQGDYVVIPRATTHRWVPAEPSAALPDRGQQPHRAAEALPVALRAAARARAVLRARPARAHASRSSSRARTSRCWSSTAPAPASSAPG